MKKHFISFSYLFIGFLLLSCNVDNNTSQSSHENPKEMKEIADSKTINLDVFKDPNCGCCSKWISHLEDNHFHVNAINTNDLDSIKAEHKIEGKYQSCHTGISQDGYFFEGHVPAKYIQKFLAEKPKDATGLSVPSMPVGTPGMEVGNKFMPYKILMLMKNGDVQIYADIKNAAQQF